MPSPAVCLPGFGKVPAEFSGDFSFICYLCNPTVYYLSKNFYVHTHTHVHTCTAAHSPQLKQRPEETCKWAGSDPQLSSCSLLSPQGPAQGWEMHWHFPHLLRLSYVVFRFYIKLNEKSLGFLLKYVVKSLQRSSSTDSKVLSAACVSCGWWNHTQ